MNLSQINKRINRINNNLVGGTIRVNPRINQVIKRINQKKHAGLPLIKTGGQNNKINLSQEIGILDPHGKADNPMTGQPYTDLPQYQNLAKIWSNLPVYEQRREFIEAIYQNQVILVAAGTGSGKTVLVPKYALHTYGYQARIAVTNPKRIPSEGAAEFAAKAMDVKLGEEVGYQHRFARMIDKGGKKSKLIFCTDGLINAKISGRDPVLKEYDMIIIDEAHERNVQIDFLLLNLRRALLKRRDLKLIIMSATIDEQKFIDYFPSNLFRFAHLSAAGKPFKEIREYYLPKPINKFDSIGNLTNKDYIPQAVERVIQIIASGEPGNILVFVTSNTDGKEACRLLQDELKKRAIKHRPFCIELHSKSKEENKFYAVGELPYQERNNGPWDRKVVMATDVAESAITFKDVVKFVVDTGLSNQDYYYTDKGMSALERKYISKASHLQRRGRTGRQESGTCYNLFTEKEYQKMFADYSIPPIKKSDLTEPIFKLFNSPYISYATYPFRYEKKYKEWKDFTQADVDRIVEGEKDTLDVVLHELIDPPEENFVNNSLKRLLIMGALDVKKGDQVCLSKLGMGMNVFRSTPPEISRMIIAGYDYFVRDDIFIIAAMLEASEGQFDIFFVPPFKPAFRNAGDYKAAMKKYDGVRKKLAVSSGDHLSLHKLYQLFEAKKEQLFKKHTGNKNKVGKVFAELREWCAENFINYKKMSSINRDYIKGYRSRLDELVRPKRQNENRPPGEAEGGAGGRLFLSPEVKLHSKKEDNILEAVLTGFKHNLCRQANKDIEICYPVERTFTSIDRESSLKFYKTVGKYYVYYDYISIFGRSNINIVSKVPESVVERLPKNILRSCFEPTVTKKKNENKKKERKDRGRKKDRKR